MDTAESSDDLHVNPGVRNQDLTENSFFINTQKYITHTKIDKIVKIKNDLNFTILTVK